MAAIDKQAAVRVGVEVPRCAAAFGAFEIMPQRLGTARSRENVAGATGRSTRATSVQWRANAVVRLRTAFYFCNVSCVSLRLQRAHAPLYLFFAREVPGVTWERSAL
jgi:hypothetical protein